MIQIVVFRNQFQTYLCTHPTIRANQTFKHFNHLVGLINLISIGKKGMLIRQKIENYNMDYYNYNEWTPQELSLKRNFDI